jgi:hypothetical protein
MTSAVWYKGADVALRKSRPLSRFGIAENQLDMSCIVRKCGVRSPGSSTSRRYRTKIYKNNLTLQEKQPIVRFLSPLEDAKIAVRNLMSLYDRGILSEAFALEIKSQADESPSQEPSIPLPEKAPRLWADRKGKTNPVAFIREVYSDWLGINLTRAFIRNADQELYDAYAKWIKRHSEDDLNLPTRTLTKYDQTVTEMKAVSNWKPIAELDPEKAAQVREYLAFNKRKQRYKSKSPNY